MKQNRLNGWKAVALASLTWAAFIVSGAAYADELSLGALKAQGAERVTKDDLTALLTGASLSRQVERGDVYINTQKDGSLNARYQSKLRNARQLKGYGTWTVNDEGKYCMEIKWERGFEDVSGCRDMYKAGEDYYGAGSTADDAKLYHYKISK